MIVSTGKIYNVLSTRAENSLNVLWVVFFTATSLKHLAVKLNMFLIWIKPCEREGILNAIPPTSSMAFLLFFFHFCCGHLSIKNRLPIESLLKTFACQKPLQVILENLSPSIVLFILLAEDNTRVVCNGYHKIGIDWSLFFAFSSAPRIESFLFLPPSPLFCSSCLVEGVGVKLETSTI